jgi:hypothetical protein
MVTPTVDLSVETCAPLLQRLNTKVQHHLKLIEETDLWKTISSTETEPKVVASILKYVMLESFSFAPPIVRAFLHAIGRFPHRHHEICRLAADVILDDVPHSELALRDFVALGGNEQWARSRRITHESFVFAAVCKMLCDFENPFSHLGPMYYVESLTVNLVGRARSFLESKGVGRTSRKFVEVHAVEDIDHVREVAHVIEKAVAAFPDAEAAIEYGLDVTTCVYPYPLWEKIMRHVRAEMQGLPII